MTILTRRPNKGKPPLAGIHDRYARTYMSGAKAMSIPELESLLEAATTDTELNSNVRQLVVERCKTLIIKAKRASLNGST